VAIGLAFLVGLEHAGRLRAPMIAANLLAVVGIVGITEGQLSSAGSGWSQLFDTSLSGAFVTRLVPALVGAVALIAAPRLSERMQRPIMAVVWIGAALSTLADAAANHASTEAIPILSVLLQWVHILAGGLWVGGLAALLVVISATPSEGRGRLLERFAVISIACLIVIAVTGGASVGGSHRLVAGSREHRIRRIGTSQGGAHTRAGTLGGGEPAQLGALVGAREGL